MPTPPTPFPQTTPLTRRELDAARCQHGCDSHPVYIAPDCHPGARFSLAYDRAAGVLRLRCVCGRHGTAIAVAPGLAQ